MHKFLPPDRSASQGGKQHFDAEGGPLLSWRVHILPDLEQQELYEKFHFDEPWDSEHNKPLLAEMPALFQTTDEGTKTTLLAVVGEGAAYEGKEGLKFTARRHTRHQRNAVDAALPPAYLR